MFSKKVAIAIDFLVKDVTLKKAKITPFIV